MKKVLIIISLCYLQISCSSDSSSNSEQIATNNPSIVELKFPYENSLCNVGTNITPNQSTVLFEWEIGENTDSYTLNLKNLTTGIINTYQSTTNKISIDIARGTPFEWYIISNSKLVTTTAMSNTWRFYNTNDGIKSYAPFPAEIVTPKMAEIINPTKTTITLDWNGNDIDNDIVQYDVYFGTTKTPSIISSGLNLSIMNNVSIAPNTIYYWKIITRDSKGNSSDSGVFEFKIK